VLSYSCLLRKSVPFSTPRNLVITRNNNNKNNNRNNNIKIIIKSNDRWREPFRITKELPLHKSMGQTASRKSNMSSSSKTISRILWKPEMYYRNHKVRHLSLFLTRLIQSSPHSTSWISILILSSHLRLDFQEVSFAHVSSPHRCINLFSFSQTRNMPRPLHLSCFRHPNDI
jgi:hypothetical protein